MIKSLLNNEKFQDRVATILAALTIIIIACVLTYAILWGINEAAYLVSGRYIGEPAPIGEICAYAENVTQTCIDYRIDQCLATERYSLDQCVTLVGK